MLGVGSSLVEEAGVKGKSEGVGEVKGACYREPVCAEVTREGAEETGQGETN